MIEDSSPGGELKVVPAEDELRAALLDVKSQNPTLGIPKLHGLLLSTQTTWTVSEKRVRKVLQNAGLLNAPSKRKIYPSSKVMEKLDTKLYTTKVEVRYFDKVKGKGLVAKEAIAEGETVWKEDPFVLAPEWGIFDLQQNSRACAHCSTPLSAHHGFACQASTSASFCPARFCNRLCLSRSSKTHPLLCQSRNPASVALLKFARSSEWMALHALSQLTSRILMAGQTSGEALDVDWEVVQGLAVLGMEDRVKDILLGGEPDRATWMKAHQLYLQAFKEPTAIADQKKLSRILRRPLREDIGKGLFEYDSFLRGLGRMSLNLEAHGGLYTLHSHLNHSCSPNISVRHLDKQTFLSRITIVAKKDIKCGEELLVTYVNPEGGLKTRRDELLSWGFGLCLCKRCTEEEKTGRDDNNKVNATEMEDLEKELKAGLGVM